MSTPFQFFHPEVRLISVVREKKALFALLNHPQITKEDSEATSSEHDDKVDWGNYYEFTKWPLSKLPKSFFSQAERLIDEWEVISQARYLDTEVLDSLLYVLLNTVPTYNASPYPLPSLELIEKRKSFAPTAARPRASKGTKDRPKKLSQPEATDLRIYITSRDGSQRVLKYFQALLPKAITRMTKKGVLSNQQIKNIKPIDLIPFLTLPGLHSQRMREDLRGLPSKFLQHLLPGMRMKKTKEIRELLSLFHKLRLDTNDSLLAAMSRLVCDKKR